MTLLIIVCVLLVAAGTAVWILIRPSDWALARASLLSPGVVFRIDTRQRVIALTIDDAPHPDVTPDMLRELRAHGARATFFILGENAAAYPELIDAIRADGHELANHLYTDRMSASLSDKEFLDELMRTDALIKPHGSPRWCRPGSGVITRRVARLIEKSGYTPVAATAYPVDLHAIVDITLRQFMNNVRPGAILVLHDGGPARSQNVEVLSRMLRKVEAMGFRVTTLGDLSRLETGEPE